MNSDEMKALDDLYNKYEFDDNDKTYVQYANTPNTANINHSKVIGSLILTKQLKKSAEILEQSNHSLNEQLKDSTERLIESNKNLAQAEDRHSRWMRYLTCALVFVGLVQAIAMLITIFK